MSERKTALGTLPVLRDDPLFWGPESFDRSLDAFDHEAYARAILKILIENKPPLSIGLFGPWGIGKSTIVSILFKLIGQESGKKLKPIYFNAWKYSGDSFRRQFLIEVAGQVYEQGPEKEEAVERLRKLNYSAVLHKPTEESLWAKIRGLVKNISVPKPTLVRLIFLGIFALVGAVVYYFSGNIRDSLIAWFLGFFAWLLPRKLEDVVVIRESIDYDPQLIFPEQFQGEFRTLVSPTGPLGGARAVIAIDDIDRCDPATIRDILTSIKTFLGEQNCYFVVPCDDRSIVQVFQDLNQKGGYQDELLRKYFNVGVRIAPLMATDLVDFANSVSKKTEMPASVVQIAILANYRDARKMKHFLNTFAVKYSIARARQESGFMPIDIDQNLPGFAKAVLIEDLYPGLFAKMVEHPEIYEILERAALGGEVEADLKKWDLVNWMTEYPGLRSILEKTRDIKIEHIEVFLSLKTTNPEARIPGGFELKNSIVQGDATAVENASKGVTTDQARVALTDLLLDLLDKTTDTFLKNTISSALWCYTRDGLLASADKPRLARGICQSLVYNEGQRALQQPAVVTLQCAKDAGGSFLADLLSKYRSELAGLDQPTDSTANTINALYQFDSQPQSLSASLNKRLEQWTSSDKGLATLANINLPESVSKQDGVPSFVVLAQISSAISPEATSTALSGNTLRRRVLFKNWDDRLAPFIAERLLEILQQGQSDTGYTPRLSFAIQAIIDKHLILEETYSSQLWAQIQQVFARLSDADARFEVHKVVLVFAAKCPVAGPQQQAKNFALQNWQGFSDEQLRKVLAYLPALEDMGRDELQKSLVQQELSTAQTELQNPTERTRQRLDLCFEKRTLIPSNSVDGLLLRTLEASDNAFTVWRAIVTEYATKLESEFPKQVAERCLSLVTGSYSQPRRQMFFELFATVLTAVGPDTKPRLLQTYFALCKHADSNIRNPAAVILGKVKKAVEEQDFKLGLNTLVRDFCRMTPSEVGPYRPMFDATLEHSPLFGDYEWRDLADLGKRCVQQADVALQDYGLSLIERMPRIPKEHEEDIIHLLIGMARGTNAGQRERADKLLRKTPESELGGRASQALREYLAPPSQEAKDKS